MDGTMWYHSHRTKAMEERLKTMGKVHRVSASFSWGNGLVDQAWIDGGNGRTDPTREPFGFLGDSGHYPISAVLWAFGWTLPVKVQALHTKRNKIGAIITCEAFLWFSNGGRAIIDCSCENPHRSQFEIVCDKGVLKSMILWWSGSVRKFWGLHRPICGIIKLHRWRRDGKGHGGGG